MKKLLSVMLAAAMILSLAACGSSGGYDEKAEKDELVGTWKAVSAKYNGEDYDIPVITIEAREDGTFTFTVGESTPSEGTWTNDNGSYTFTAIGLKKGSISGGRLTLETEGMAEPMSMVFEKQ